MKMNDEKELPVAQEIAWKALNDISLLKSCIPGCESIEMKDGDNYDVVIAAAVGPVKARFKGQMSMKNISGPTSYTLEFSGQGGAVGYCRGEAQVVLSVLEPDKTLLRYSATASVGGKLAQVGARLIDMAAQKMAADFFEAFLSELNRRHAPIELARAEPALASARSETRDSVGVWASVIAWLSKLFGKPAT